MMLKIFFGECAMLSRLRLVLAIAVLSGSSAVLLAAEEVQYDELVRLDYIAMGELISVGSGATASGFTINTLHSDNVGKTRIAVSTAIRKGEMDLQDLRVVAVTKTGQTLTARNGSAAAGNGQELVTVTVISEFPTFRNNIERLIVQRKKPGQSPPNPSPLSVAEARRGEKAGQTITQWGIAADPDGDCEILATDEKLTMTVPARSHDLHPLGGNNSPSVLNRVGGDFTFQVKLTGDFVPGSKSLGAGRPFNGAGILIWENERNYLRVERNAYWISDTVLNCFPPLIEYWRQYREQGANTAPGKVDFFQGTTTWLKVNREGKKIAVSLSHDGKEWSDIKTVPIDMADEVYVGVAAINTSNTPFKVEFSEFDLSAERRFPAILGLGRRTEPNLRMGLLTMDISNRGITNAELYRLCNESMLGSLNAANTPITDEGLKEIVRAKKLSNLDLTETQVTDAGMKDLGSLKSLSKLSLGRVKITDQGLKELCALTELTSIGLRETRITDEGLVELSRLPKLSSLDLSGTSVTDAGLAEIGKLKNLTDLSLGRTQITDAGLIHLASLEKLTRLDLSNTTVGDVGTKTISTFKKLKELNLNQSKITDDGVLELASLDNLVDLHLAQAHLTERGLKHLSEYLGLKKLDLSHSTLSDVAANELGQLRHLTELALRSTAITDLAMKDIAKLTRLTLLDLDATGLTDQGLKELAGLTSLRKLSIQKNPVTDAAVDELQLSHSRCEIRR